MKRISKGQLVAAAIVAVLLAVLVGADSLVAHHPAFTIDGWPGFAAIYGLVAALAAIGIASLYADLARRQETDADGEAAAEKEGRDD